APNRDGVINRSRVLWLFDRAFISEVALPTALVVISVPPGAGMNSLFRPRNPARSSVIGPLPPGRPLAAAVMWQAAQEVSLKWMPSPVAGVITRSNAAC